MKYLNKTIEYGFYLLVFLLPFGTRWIIKAGQLNGGPWEYGTYSLYATDILLIFVLLLFIIHKIAHPLDATSDQAGLVASSGAGAPSRLFAMAEKRARDGRMICWFIGGLLLTAVVSSVFALDKALALYKFGWLILGVGLFWLATSATYDRAKLIYAMLAGAFLQAGLGIWQFLNQTSFASKWLGLAWHEGVDLGAAVVLAVGADGVAERWLRAYGGLDHPNILGGLLAVAILLLAGERLRENQGYEIFHPHDQAANKFPIPMANIQRNYIYWIWLVTFTAGWFFSFSRSAWLALVVGLAVMIVWAALGRDLKLQKSLAETVLVTGIFLLILFSQYQNLITARLGVEGRLEEKSKNERLVSYQEAWRLIKNNWLFGVGSGNYTLAIHNKITPGQTAYYYQPAHNVFTLVWAETGILGIIFFAGLIIYSLILNYGKSAYGGNNFKVKAAILAAIVALMSFDHWLWSLHFGVLFFWLILGLVSGSKKDNRLITV